MLLLYFSYHPICTFIIRMCEADINIKVIQDSLGHKNISTIKIYVDVTRDLKTMNFKN